MKHAPIDIKRLLVVIILVTLMTVIASLTLGKDIYEDNARGGMLSFVVLNFSGYLFFFLFMPVEIAFVFYLRSGFDPLILNIIAVATAISAQAIDYLFGYFLSIGIINRLIGQRRYEKAKDEIRKYGKLALFLFNLLPVSSSVISLAAGMLKYNVKNALIFSISGLVCRYLLLTLIF